MRVGLAIAAGLGALAVATPAFGQGPVQGYDGSNPFNCVLQQAGYGSTVPDPDADPFCVEYQKRRQNVTDLGVVEFLSHEPARFALAGDKCFYFQHDHWTGSVVQDNAQTETYSWDGSYFFDKARGLGGAYVDNFTVNNQTGDPRDLPGFPEEYKPYFGPGRGGAYTTDTVGVDPACVEKAKTGNVYRKSGKGAKTGRELSRCKRPRGSVGRGVGGMKLGMTRREVEQALGEAQRRRRGFLRYCVVGGGKLMAGFSRGHARFLLTSSPGFEAHGVKRGMSSREARSRLDGERTLVRRGGATALSVREEGYRLLVSIRRGRVNYLAAVADGLRKRRIARFIKNSR
jgi:hypothetical protein